MNQPGGLVPVAFDLSTLVQRSVASLYSHLVTRPTGQALRLGIESQLCELGSFCVSVLDFTQVAVLDYSCADEVIAKLLQRYQRSDRPTDAYFIARGLAEEHRDPIEEVLERHKLSLVAEVEGQFNLLGHASASERTVWWTLQQLTSAEADDVAAHAELPPPQAAVALNELVARRSVLRSVTTTRYYSLTALLRL
jgi:hypothetical protein